jgi:cell fate (sporulation/competence/biofilm development) regulator YmcA (YheA/YmcA/DUF963 family)
MTRKPVTVKIESGVVEQLEAEADEKDMNRSEYLRSLIRQRHGTQEVVDELSKQTKTEDQLREEIRIELDQEYQQRIRELKAKIAELEEVRQEDLDQIYAKAEELMRDKYQSDLDRLQKRNDDLQDQVDEWEDLARQGEVMANIVKEDDKFDTFRVEDQKTYTNEHIKAEVEQIKKNLNDLDGTQRRIETRLKSIFNRLQPIDVRFKQRVASVFSRGE